MALSSQALRQPQEHGETPSIACDLLKDWASKPEVYYFVNNAVTGEERARAEGPRRRGARLGL